MAADHVRLALARQARKHAAQMSVARSATFQLYIRTGNDAFAPDPAPEVTRILREIADSIERNGEVPFLFKTIYDVNGNDVGRYALKETA